jgi:hypothetical protein
MFRHPAIRAAKLKTSYKKHFDPSFSLTKDINVFSKLLKTFGCEIFCWFGGTGDFFY